MPEHILSKPGPLTQEEFQKIRIHPQVGAEIIAAVPFPYPVAPLILSHHERWDGKGYPQGLAGDDIPIGARILTIVDYYDAVTTERPYHKALNNDSALGLLRHEAGRALDPELVPIVHRDPAGAGRRSSATEVREVVETPQEPFVTGSTAVGLVPAIGHSAFENIALAHREIYALYEIAQSMGTSLGVSDTMALISSKLSKIVPWSGCALFLHQPDGRLAEVPVRGGRRRAAAAERDAARSGEGLSGWVARNRRTLINANPRVTLRGGGPGAATSRCSRRSSARCSSTTRSSAAWRSTTSEPQPLHRGSPPAARARSPNRPAPSSTTRSSSSRRRKIR